METNFLEYGIYYLLHYPLNIKILTCLVLKSNQQWCSINLNTPFLLQNVNVNIIPMCVKQRWYATVPFHPTLLLLTLAWSMHVCFYSSHLNSTHIGMINVCFCSSHLTSTYIGMINVCFCSSHLTSTHIGMINVFFYAWVCILRWICICMCILYMNVYLNHKGLNLIMG